MEVADEEGVGLAFAHGGEDHGGDGFLVGAIPAEFRKEALRHGATGEGIR